MDPRQVVLIAAVVVVALAAIVGAVLELQSVLAFDWSSA